MGSDFAQARLSPPIGPSWFQWSAVGQDVLYNRIEADALLRPLFGREASDAAGRRPRDHAGSTVHHAVAGGHVEAPRAPCWRGAGERPLRGGKRALALAVKRESLFAGMPCPLVASWSVRAVGAPDRRRNARRCEFMIMNMNTRRS
jgi:hypothetical protein